MGGSVCLERVQWPRMFGRGIGGTVLGRLGEATALLLFPTIMSVAYPDPDTPRLGQRPFSTDAIPITRVIILTIIGFLYPIDDLQPKGKGRLRPS